MISCKEVFCSELPSPSNIFLSSSCHNVKSNNSNNNGLCYQFASERHSLTLQTHNNVHEEERGHTLTTLPKMNNGYKLIVERLLQNSKQSKKSSPSTATATTTATSCVAHSSLQINNISIRSFAIRIGDLTTNSPTHKNGSSHCSQDDQATVTTNVTTATTANTPPNKEGTVNNGHGVDGSNSGDMIITSGDQGTIPSSSKYAFIFKYHPLVNTDNAGTDENATTRTTAKTERINLDFRPISVHLTEIHSSSSSAAAAAAAATTKQLIGAYVAGDDNKLHFFVASLQSLEEKLLEEVEENVAEATMTSTTTTKPECARCFQPSRCFETIDDPSNIISASASKNGESCELSTKEIVDDKPLVFATPIMAVDACVSEGRGNIIAVACYDGVIRILRYVIDCTSDLNVVIRIVKLQYSTFIVDGPVTTLHFHNNITKKPGRLSHSGASDKEDGWCDNNLFLLAGSLCGLAFLFYEVCPSNFEDKSFAGPIVVVDGLYDADKEGFEDCVTAVHVMRYHDVTILAVGTQGCRLLLFEQQQQQNHSIENEARQEHDKQLLTAEIERKSEEMMHLSFERDRLTHVISDLRQKRLELENSEQEEEVIHSDIVTPSGSGTGNGDEVKSDQLSIAPKVERMSSIKAEIDEAELSCSNCSSMISRLQSSIESLTHKLNDLSVPSPQDSKLLRKMHRYEYLSEHKLPYPIQGIGSNVRECVVATRQTIHIFHILTSQMVDAAAASLEKKLLSFLNKTEDSK